MRILDKFGNERTAQELEQYYGPFKWMEPANPDSPAFMVVQLQERADPNEGFPTIVGEKKHKAMRPRPDAPAVIVVKVIDSKGNPMPGVPVAWWWPDVAQAPDAQKTSNGYGVAIVDETNSEGLIGFAMGSGANYQPPNRGPHAIWIADLNSQLSHGFGMLMFTNHAHLEPTFQLTSVPEPPPNGPDWVAIAAEILEHITVVQDGIQGIYDALKESQVKPSGKS